ncbi:MAG: sigma-70 family RNA polymerase sigma factor [Phycisphaeraceae bacterium]
MTQNTEQFVRLYARHEQAIHRYVYGLLPNADDAQEVMQETAVALWRRFDTYDQNLPFAPWACGFARLEVLKHYRNRKGLPCPLSEEVIERLASQYDGELDDLNRRRQALDDCLRKLPPKDSSLVRIRYETNTTIREMAQRDGASEHTLYKALERIRRALFDCVTQSLEMQDTV